MFFDRKHGRLVGCCRKWLINHKYDSNTRKFTRISDGTHHVPCSKIQYLRHVVSFKPEGHGAIIRPSQNPKEKLKMKNTLAQKIILIAESILALGAFILLSISMFGNVASNLPLTGGLACVSVAGILNVIYLVIRNKVSKT